MNIGPHVTHCCVIHGCKYRDDDCPVVLGIAEQDGPCEDCETSGIRSVKELRRMVELKGTDIEEKVEALSIGLQGIDMMWDYYPDNSPGRGRYERERQFLYSILDGLYEQAEGRYPCSGKKMVEESWINSLKLITPTQRGSAATNLDLQWMSGAISREQYEWLAERGQWGWRSDNGYKG